MVTIIGTEKIRGVLELSSVGLQLKKGDQIPITDDQFVSQDVQMALKMGYLRKRYEEDIVSIKGKITLKNICERTIFVSAINSQVQPGQSFALSESQISGSEIQGALAKGMIDIVSSTKVSPLSETNVRIGNIFEAQKPLAKTSALAEETIEETTLETNEEASEPRVVEERNVYHEPDAIKDENPSPVRKDDIKDPKRKSVIWNPNADPVIHTRTSTPQISAGESDNAERDSVNFVDKKIEEERKNKHPILKNKPEDVEVDLDFL